MPGKTGPLTKEFADFLLGKIVKKDVGKSFDPRFDPRVQEQEKLKNLVTTVEEYPASKVPKVSLVDFEGRPFVTSMSDRTAAGGKLLGINDIELKRPVELRGGKDYMFHNPGQVWASAKNPVNQIMREAITMKDFTGQNPVYIPWRMAPTASDFAHMTGETMLSHAESALGKSEKKALDSAIKDFIPDWKGLNSPVSFEQFGQATTAVRKAIQNMIDKTFRDKGALGIGETRLAIADPKQINAPEGGIMNIGEIFVDKPIIQKSGHPSYPYGVPGQGLGRLDKDLIVTELLPKMVKERGISIPKDPSAQDLRALQMKPYTGIIDDKLLKLLGYKDGGLACLKEGGKTPAWQRKEGKNPEGGLNAIGRASYNRETGGNLKPPVSSEQAKKSPKSAARRKSFCARMSGNPGPMKDEHGKPTRKALALRKWDC